MHVLRAKRSPSRLLLTVLAVLLGSLLVACPGGEGGESGGSDGITESQSAMSTALQEGSCPVCGMPTDTSATTVEAEAVTLDSLPCWVEYAERNNMNPEKAVVLDYATLSGERAKVRVTEAHYVPTDGLQSSMPPYLAAFAEREDAEEFAGERESEVIGFEAAVEQVEAYFDEHGYHSHGD